MHWVVRNCCRSTGFRGQSSCRCLSLSAVEACHSVPCSCRSSLVSLKDTHMVSTDEPAKETVEVLKNLKPPGLKGKDNERNKDTVDTFLSKWGETHQMRGTIDNNKPHHTWEPENTVNQKGEWPCSQWRKAVRHIPKGMLASGGLKETEKQRQAHSLPGPSCE